MTFVTQVEARVIGSLLEKETTTPDYYPLSINALLNACNQKSNREPMMDLDEDAVRTALHTLQDKGLAQSINNSESRVPKYEHHLETFNLSRREAALVCVLLLRGPQTPGELRGRADRLFHFDELSDVQSTLQRLMQRDPPLVKLLPRQPGNKEARYAHLFCGDAGLNPGLDANFDASVDANLPVAAVSASGTGGDDRILRIEDQLAALASEVSALKQQISNVLAHFT